MKTQRFLLLLVMLATATLWSCSPDNVGPKDSNSANNATPTMTGDGVAHPTIPNVCGDSITLNLIDETGSENVTYCGLIPCGTGLTPEWGSVTCFNTDSAMYFNVSLTFGWFLELNRCYIGLEEDMTYDSNGIPQMETSWLNYDVNPVVNSYQLEMPTMNLAGDCADITSVFTVVKLDFFSGVDQNSRRRLWLHNPMHDDPNNAWANSGSAFSYPYCGLACGAVAEPECPDVPEYCDINFSNSSYEWIDNISIGTVDNNSGNDQGYGDYTSQEATIEAGGTATITMTPGFSSTCAYYERWVVFIDYNRDGDFYDSGELVTWGAGTGAVTRTFNVPSNAEDCELRMRVAMRWGCWPSGPCCNYYYGEAEDYTIFVNGTNTNRVAPRVNDNALQSLVIQETDAPGDVEVIKGEQLQVRSGSAQTLEVEVLDQNGKIVQSQTIKAKAGLNDVNFRGISSADLQGYTYRVKGGLERNASEMEMNVPTSMK